MGRYKDATFPPTGAWDPRLTELACPDLQPVDELHRNEWFTVRNRGGYFTVEYELPHVLVLPVVDGEAIAMVRVKRPVIGDITLELPAGAIEGNEPPAMGAAREMAEETGIVAEVTRFSPLPPLSISPTRVPRLAHIFRVDLRRREFDERGQHDDEIDSVELVSLADCVRLMNTGGIYVAAPIAVISRYILSRSL